MPNCEEGYSLPAIFCLGDKVSGATIDPGYVQEIRDDGGGGFEYGIVVGNVPTVPAEPYTAETSLTLIEHTITPRYSVGDLVLIDGSANPGPFTILSRFFQLPGGEPDYLYGFNGGVPFIQGTLSESAFTDLEGGIPDRLPCLAVVPTCSLVERDFVGSGVILSGATSGIGFFEGITLAATILDDPGMDAVITWQASSGVITQSNYNTAEWLSPGFETQALVDIFINGQIQLACRSTFQTPPQPADAPGLVTCLHIEKAPRHSEAIVSQAITNIEQNEAILLVATILNDDGRRDNITWLASSGAITFQAWDQAQYQAPAFEVLDSVFIVIDGAIQFGSQVLFRVPAAPLPEPDTLDLVDLLSSDFWRTTASRLSLVIAQTEEGLPNQIAGLLGSLTTQNDGILSGVGGFFSFEGGVPSWLSLNNTTLLDAGVAQLTAAFGGALLPIHDVLEGLFPSLEDLQEGGDWRSALQDLLAYPITFGLGIFFDSLEAILAPLFKPFIDPILGSQEIDDFVQDLFGQIAEPQAAAMLPLLALFGGAVVVGGAAKLGAPWIRDIEYFTNRFKPNLLLSPAQYVDAVLRDFGDPAEHQRDLLSQGFDPDRQALFQELARPRLDINGVNLQVLRWELQQAAVGGNQLVQELAQPFAGGVSPEAGEELLRVLGYANTTREQLLDQRRQLPGMQDLVRFAVREGFGDPTEPDLIERLGLDDEFPPEIVPFAIGQGFTQEWAEIFWRSHWELPSIQEGFNMRHRTAFEPFFSDQPAAGSVGAGTAEDPVRNVYTVATEQDINSLFKQADILPFWRPRLEQIAFNVISRVDVRRMFDMGIFTAGEVEAVYRSQGYNETDARNLARFVERLSIQPRLTARNTEVRQQFRDGLIDRPTAEAQLQGLILTSAELQEELQTLDLDRQGTRLSREVTAWDGAFRKKLIEESTFRAELTRLEVPPEEIDFRVTLANIARPLSEDTDQAEIAASGRGTVIRRYREGQIDAAGFGEEMAILGYAELQTEQFLALADLELETNLSLDLLAAFRAGLRTGRLTEAEFRQELAQLPIVRTELIDAYVQADTLARKLEPVGVEDLEIRASGVGTVTSRYREGWITGGDFELEMESLGYTAAETERRQVIADLQFDLDFRSDALQVLRDAFNRGQLTAPEFLSRLDTLGMDQERATVHLAREQLRLLSRGEPADETGGDIVLP